MVTGKPVIVRAYFTSYLSDVNGQTIAINNLVDMEKVAEAEAAGEEYSAEIDPITTAVLQKVINVFTDLGLTLNEAQYASLEAVVTSVIQTAMAEASAEGTSFTLDESYLVTDDPAIDTSAVGDFLDSEVVDGAVSGLETEASDFADAGDPTSIVNKYINWLTSMGFFIDDEAGKIYVRVPEMVPDGAGGEIDVITVLAGTANSGVTVPAADTGFADNMILVDLDLLFALDAGLTLDTIMSIVGLDLVDGDDTVVVRQRIHLLAPEFTIRTPAVDEHQGSLAPPTVFVDDRNPVRPGCGSLHRPLRVRDRHRVAAGQQTYGRQGQAHQKTSHRSGPFDVPRLGSVGSHRAPADAKRMTIAQ